MPVDDIETAFLRVKDLVRRMMDGESLRSETLRAIFELNNEVGILARSDRKMKRDLVPLQQYVNAITVGLKNTDSKMTQEGVVEVEQILLKLKCASDAEVVHK